MQRERATQWRWRLLLIGVLWLAFALRLYRLDFQELRGDESFGYFFSLRTLPDIVRSTFALLEPHPVASYFLQHFWFMLSGTSEFAMRFSGVCWSTLTVALLYRLARRLDFSQTSASLTAFPLAISPYAIWHSQDARMYNMSMALSLAALWLGLEWLKEQRLRVGLGFVLAALLALHTHYYTIYILLAFYLFLIFFYFPSLNFPSFNFQRRMLVVLAMPTLAIVLLYAPWLWFARHTLLGYHGNGDSPTLGSMLARSLSAFAVGETIPIDQRVLWGSIAGAALLVALLLQVRERRLQWRWLFFLLCLLFVPLLLTWLGARARPIFNERYLVPLLPFFLLWIAFGVEQWGSVGWRSFRQLRIGTKLLAGCHLALLIALLLGMGISLGNYYNDPRYSKTSGWRELATAIRQASIGFADEKLRWAQNYPDPTLWYYTGETVAHLVLPQSANSQQSAEWEVEQMLKAGVERVVLIAQPSPGWDADGIAERVLSAHFTPTWQRTLRKGVLQIYDQSPQPFSADETFAFEPLALEPFANSLQLRGFAILPRSAVADGVLPDEVMTVYLQWQKSASATPAKPSGTEKVTVQLLDAAGQLLAQDDRAFSADLSGADSSVTLHYVLALPSQLPAGNYRLIVALYDPAQANAPRIRTLDGRDAIELTTIAPAN